MRRRGLAGAFCLVFLAHVPAATAEPGVVPFSDDERAMIAAHGPWPPPAEPDPSNRGSGDAAAIALGAELFFDTRLSADGALSCATCHDPGMAFTDGAATGKGRAPLARNTPGLANLRIHRWFGWDGGNDSLWSQSLRPIVEPTEMAASPAQVAVRLRDDPALACRFSRAFDVDLAALPPDDLLVLVGKALAAYQETLVTARSKFDDFRDAVVDGDWARAARYPVDAQRGLKLFVGRGNCSLCHFGPAFTNGEFADIGLPHFRPDGGVDKGRYGGIRHLRETPYNLLGRFNDDPDRTTAAPTRHVAPKHQDFGAFRVPSLRNVAMTAPYMHDGRIAMLRDVIRHYSELDMERLHTDGEAILRPLHLSEAETDDLIAFLNSLTAPVLADLHPAAPDGCEG